MGPAPKSVIGDENQLDITNENDAPIKKEQEDACSFYSTSSSSAVGYNDIESMVEIRPGRTIYRRTVTILPPSQQPQQERDRLFARVLFVHGSCASSLQFDQLLECIATRVLRKRRGMSRCDVLERMNDAQDDCHEKETPQTSSTSTTQATNTIDGDRGVQCHFYDALGCGRSTHDPSDYFAFSEEEYTKDLIQIYRSILKPTAVHCTHDYDNDTTQHCENEKEQGEEVSSAPIFIVAHSYGPTHVVRLINILGEEEEEDGEGKAENKAGGIAGVVFIGSSLGDGLLHEQGLTCDGGHFLFRFSPLWLLRLLQPTLSQGFVNNAYHSNCDGKIKKRGLDSCNKNDMKMCQAYYRQTRWAKSEEAQKVKTKALLIHGEEDGIIPLCGGQHFSDVLPNSKDLVVIPQTKHQVFEEKPHVVCNLILDFIAETLGSR